MKYFKAGYGIPLWERIIFSDDRCLKDWLIALVNPQHNARVIGDFEDRMSSVIYTATGGMMSKPYYEKEAMIAQIEDALSKSYEEGYKDAQEETNP